MISRPKPLIPCLLAVAIVLVIPPNIRGQQDATRPAADDTQKKKDAEHRQELEKKTHTLLNEIASAAWSLKLPENRLFVLANAGDLFWTIDEKRARALYWDAVNSLSSLSPAVRNPGENLSKTEREKIMQAYVSVFTLRQKLLLQIARRDAQLALEMLRATRQVPLRQLGKEALLADERRLEQEIASEIAARDPAQALQLARQSLAKGLTLEVLNFVYQLDQKDSEKALQFAGEIITKLQTTDVAKDFRASIIALSLLENSRVPNADRRVTLGSVRGYKALSLNDEHRRQLVEILIDAALSVSANSNLLAEMAEVMPEIEQFFPERRAALERKLAAFNETLTPKQRFENSYMNLIRRGVPEEIFRAANSADNVNRMSLYYQAAISAIHQGKADSFRDLVSKEISDDGARRSVLDFMDGEELNVAAHRKQLDELRKLLPKIRRKEERARAMITVALILKEKGEDEEAVTLLDEAATLIKTDIKDETHTNALLTLLCAYAIVDPPKAFALAERTVDHANSQVSLLMLLDKIVKSGAVKKSEIILDQAGLMPLDFLVFRYGKGVAALAKTDFDRTKALADRFERNELKIMAQLMIVRGILQPESQSVTNFAFVRGN